MTYDTLTAIVSDFGSEQTFMTHQLVSYNKKNNTDHISIVNMYYTEAKQQLILDLQEMLGLDPEDTFDMETIDTLIDNNQSRMRRVLAVLQISLMYEELGGGSDTFNYKQMIKYSAQYKSMKNGFNGLKGKTGRDSTSYLSIQI